MPEDDTQSVSEPHNDIDISLAFQNLNKEAPKFEEITEAAKKFGDSHRYLINQLILEPSMHSRKFNRLFAQHHAFTRLKKHPHAVTQLDISEQQVRELTKLIVKTMNTEKGIQGIRPWRFVISSDEKSPNDYVTMTGCLSSYSSVMKDSPFIKEEQSFIHSILEEMLNTDGTVKLSWVYSQIQTDSCKMSGVKCDELLQRLFRQNYLQLDDNKTSIVIMPRLTVEFEPWIRENFKNNLKICDLCQRIIARPIYTAKCKKCNVFLHYNCFKTATEIANQDQIVCQKCKELVTLTDVQKQMDALKIWNDSCNPPDSDTETPVRTFAKPKRRAKPKSGGRSKARGRSGQTSTRITAASSFSHEIPNSSDSSPSTSAANSPLVGSLTSFKTKLLHKTSAIDVSTGSNADFPDYSLPTTSNCAPCTSQYRSSPHSPSFITSRHINSDLLDCYSDSFNRNKPHQVDSDSD